MAKNISFKSYYWGLGTTSFRMANFNLMIEQQLQLLDEFWKIKENQNAKWSRNENIQGAYYNFLKKKGFVEGDPDRKAKDARQKTSGLVDIGLIDDERRLTSVGEKLLEISLKNDFKSNNFLQIPKDSFIYFQQLLKSYIPFEDGSIRPYIILCRFLSKFEYLSWSEFVYLLPLCSNQETTEFVEKQLAKVRDSEITIDEVIINVFMGMENYKSALQYFQEEKTVTEETFKIIGMNRKSRDYDVQYYQLYIALKEYYIDARKSESNILNIYESSNLKNVAKYWRNLLFDTSSGAAIQKGLHYHFRTNLFTNCENIGEFKESFFVRMHLFKAKASLEDYSDLNRRYFKITDTILFEDSRVTFDILPKAFFTNVPEDFYNLAFKKTSDLFEYKELKSISPALEVGESKILKSLSKEHNITITEFSQAKEFVKDKRYKRFNKLINEKFSSTQLIKLLELFKNRKDREIQKLTTDGADGPTLFEYILAIAWYQISDRQGDILSYMNLSLEADLMPKTHAGGGEADIVYKYSKSENYPAHDLLIEATLADSTNQRRMEMEPVSRHLGEYLLSNKNSNAYCIFLTNFLHNNVISDFRMRKTQPYYGSNGEKISGMYITPIETDLLIQILKDDLKYRQLYKLFQEHFESSLEPKEWYKELKNKISNISKSKK